LVLQLTPQGVVQGELLDEETGSSFAFLLRSAGAGVGSAGAGAYTSFIEQPEAGNPLAGASARDLGRVRVSGTGFTLARITENKKGRSGRFIGQVPDGEPFSHGSPVFSDTLPLDAGLYPKGSRKHPTFQGFVVGETQFSDGGVLQSVLDWVKEPGASGLYPGGFRNGLLLRGDLLYGKGTDPVSVVLGLLGSGIRLEFTDGDLDPATPGRVFVADAQIALQGARLTSRVTASDLEEMKLKIVPSTGMFSGTFRHPDSALAQPVKFSGILRRLESPAGRGTFRGSANAGSVRMFKAN